MSNQLDETQLSNKIRDLKRGRGFVLEERVGRTTGYLHIMLEQSTVNLDKNVYVYVGRTQAAAIETSKVFCQLLNEHKIKHTQHLSSSCVITLNFDAPHRFFFYSFERCHTTPIFSGLAINQVYLDIPRFEGTAIHETKINEMIQRLKYKNIEIL